MKNLFSWRLPPSEADFQELWKKATFVFDANVLLDLYRVSSSTSEDYFRILEHIKDRIWLPYQVADEFFENRENVIYERVEYFNKFLSRLKELKENFSKLQSDLKEYLGAEVTELFDNDKEIYLADVEKVENLINSYSHLYLKKGKIIDWEEDKTLERLSSLFDSTKIGKPYDGETLKKLYEEAESRYQLLIPPGFLDTKKEGRKKYGDFILWRQILDFAKENSQPIIFITRDDKEDWWHKRKSQIISPRIELRREFQENVQQQFWMYRPDRFLKYAKDTFQIDINPSSIEETNQIADIEYAETESTGDDKQASENIKININMLDTTILDEKVRKALDTTILDEKVRKMSEDMQQSQKDISEIIKKLGIAKNKKSEQNEKPKTQD